MTEPTRWINDKNQALQPALLSAAKQGGNAPSRLTNHFIDHPDLL